MKAGHPIVSLFDVVWVCAIVITLINIGSCCIATHYACRAERAAELLETLEP